MALAEAVELAPSDATFTRVQEPKNPLLPTTKNHELEEHIYEVTANMGGLARDVYKKFVHQVLQQPYGNVVPLDVNGLNGPFFDVAIGGIGDPDNSNRWQDTSVREHFILGYETPATGYTDEQEVTEVHEKVLVLHSPFPVAYLPLIGTDRYSGIFIQKFAAPMDTIEAGLRVVNAMDHAAKAFPRAVVFTNPMGKLTEEYPQSRPLRHIPVNADQPWRTVFGDPTTQGIVHMNRQLDEIKYILEKDRQQ